MKLKNLVVGLAFLALAGCGCGDSGGGGGQPAATNPQFEMSTIVDPCIFPYRPDEQSEYRIDIVFDLDDSEFMNRAFGMAAGVPVNADNRSRSVVAQRIFQDVEARLLTKINDAKTAGTIPQNANIDLAFAVVRHEDFGGTNVNYQNNAGTIDAAARPFMLLMPLLRQQHPSFAASFQDAILAQTFGNGNPTIAPQTTPFQDPQSTVEALSQIATGKGIDGNGNNNTTDNGVPCSQNATNRITDSGGAPQVPSNFVDVPAVTFAANGQDPQDPTRPMFLVQDEAGAGLPSCISSGNEGGVGFRPQSLRWVIFASDIASVAPFRDSQGNPADPSVNADAATVGTSFGTVPASAFNGVTGRFGAAGGQPAAPVGLETFSPLYATGVEQAMNELTGANIEVMALGALGTQPGQTKPNVPGNDPNRVPAILAPSNPDFTPFTMESAISILTGSSVTDETNPGNPGPFPAVFNLGTVGLVNGGGNDPFVPTMSATNVNDDLVNALVERIAARIATTPPVVTTTGGPLEALPELTASLTFTLNESLADGTTNYLRSVGTTPLVQQVTIPSWYQDLSVNPNVYFQVDGAGSRINETTTRPGPQTLSLTAPVVYLLRDANLINGVAPLPIDMLSASVTAAQVAISNNTAGNANLVGLLQEKLGTLNASLGIQIDSLRLPQQNGERTAEVLAGSHTGNCLLFRDTSSVAFPTEQFGANCP